MNNRNQRRGRGDGRDRANAFPWGNMRDLSPQERLDRGIDPRDPNKYAVDDQGRMISTLIGWSPNQGSISDMLAGANKLWRNPPPDKMWRDPERSPDQLNKFVDAARNAGEKLGGQSEDRDQGGQRMREMLDMLGNKGGNSGSRIPRAGKNGMVRVSPGMYRDSKGNLVRG